MTKLAQTLKNVVKKPADKATFGTNPSDPWSAKAGLSEGSLEQYLKSKGINPEYVSKDQKIAYAKSMTFLKWKSEHQFEQVIPETMTLEPSLTQKKKSSHQSSLSAHKEIKTPRGPGSHNEAKGSQMTALTPESVSMEIHGEAKKPKPSALDKFRKASAEREKKHSEIEKKSGGMTSAIDRLQKHMNKEEIEPIDEVSKDYSFHRAKERHHEKEGDKLMAKAKSFGAYAHPTGISARKQAEKHYAKADDHRSAWKELGSKPLGEEDISELDEANITHAAHFDDPKTGKWASMALLTAKNDEDAVAQAHDLLRTDAYRNFKLSAVEKHEPIKNIKMKEEVEPIEELKKSTVKSWLGKQEVVPPKKPGMDRKAHNQRIKTRSKSWDSAIDRLTGRKPTSEDVGDPKAAVNADGQPNPQLEPVSEKKKQMSKSARMIKALYKKKGVVKEDTYDHEKEDKSVATYGKKPKEEKADKDASKGENKQQAALTLTGGKTLTGTERDTVEIDPMMRNRPGQPDVTKKDDKKDDKKEDKKKDK